MRSCSKGLEGYHVLSHQSAVIPSLADQIEGIGHAITAKELAALLSVSPLSIYKLARTRRIPSLRIGTCVRFCGKSVARWLRNQEVAVN
jgi:excisionase family DNA binding protein